MGELDKTYGAMFIGVLLSAVLFGVTNLQVFFYFQKFPRDEGWNKGAVYLLWILDALHLALCAHMLYFSLVTNYGNPLALVEMVWSFKAQIFIDAIVVVMVHTLYTFRLWKMTAVESDRPTFRKVLLWTVSTIVFLGYGAAIALCYKIMSLRLFTELLAQKWVTYLPLGWATAADVTIAAALCYLLSRCRTGFEEMDSTVTVLMLYTLNTGMITAACSVAAMLCFALLPTTFTVLCLEFLVTKLYVNSFMAMLNARAALRTQAQLSLAPSTSRSRSASGSVSAPTSPAAAYFTPQPARRHRAASTVYSGASRSSWGSPAKTDARFSSVELQPRALAGLRLDTGALGRGSVAKEDLEAGGLPQVASEDWYSSYAGARGHPHRLSLGDPVIPEFDAATMSDMDVGTLFAGDSREGLFVGLALTKD